jgi:beta-glucosidase
LRRWRRRRREGPIGVLPLNPAAATKVAVIGHNARYARNQGGGSATLVP